MHISFPFCLLPRNAVVLSLPFFPPSGRLSFVKLFRSRQALSLSQCCLPPLSRSLSLSLLLSLFYLSLWGFGKDGAFRMALKKRNMQTKTTKPIPKDLCRSHTKPICVSRLNKFQQHKERNGRKWKKGSGYDSSLINQERMPHRNPMRKTNPRERERTGFYF